MQKLHSLRPIEPPFTPTSQAILSQYPQRDGYLLKLFRVFANSERFLRKGTVNLLDRDSPLSMREREIIILRVCANNRCEYEWGVHVAAFAEHVALDAAQVRATVTDTTATEACWTPREQTLLRIVDQLCADGRLCADTLEALRRHWRTEAQLEIFALCGNYHTISFVANNSELDSEDFAARFPT